MIRLCSCSILLLLLAMPAWSAEYIDSFHSDIEVRRDGDLQVTETIRVQAEGKSIRRGIYRDFPTRYRLQGRDMVVGFEVVGVTRDGAPEPFHIRPESNGQRVYIGDKNTFLSPGIYAYRLTYRTTRQLGFFDDYDELYWNVTGTGWIFPIKRASARVSLPDTISDFRLTGYTGPQGSIDQNLEYRRVGNNEVFFETTQPLKRNEGLTIVAGWPKGIISEPSDAQRRSWFVSDHKPSLIVVAGAVLLFIYYLTLWHWLGRDPETGVIVPRYYPPTGYSPASMRFVSNMGYDKTCFTAAIINLAVKGKLEIDDNDGEFMVVKKNATDTELAPGESRVLSGLFSGGQSLSIDQANHSRLSTAISRHEGSLKRDYAKKYFNTNSWLLMPAVVASIILIAVAISDLPSEETIVKTAFFGIFSMVILIMVSAVIRGFMRRGKLGIFQSVINLAMLGIVAGFVIKSEFPFAEAMQQIPIPMVVGFLAILAMHHFFYQWLKAPTLAGRRLLDQIEGFKHYLEVAEEDEIASTEAPKFSIELYETYLPYALALDLENAWSARLEHAIAKGLVESHYSNPRWYRSRGGHGSYGRNFSTTLSNSFNSAIASSSVAPGSSSGSSGGSSGGGGGGGGGGGW